MSSAAVTSLSRFFFGLGLDSTPQVYAYTKRGLSHPCGEEGQLRDCLCRHTMPAIQVAPLTRGTQGACPSQRGQRSFTSEGDWFSTDVLHPPRGLAEPLRGQHGDDGGLTGTSTGASWLVLVQLSWAPSLVLGLLPSVGLTFFHEVGATQRNGSITCFSRQEGWTCFYPKRRNETRLPGPVRIGSDSLSTV